MLYMYENYGDVYNFIFVVIIYLIGMRSLNIFVIYMKIENSIIICFGFFDFIKK